jgi:transcription elongation GreA/GreB family factor
MKKGQDIKTKICAQLQGMLGQKLEELEANIQLLKESRDSDTKSSAGDKHETARAMVQIELEKSEVQLGKLLATQAELLRIHPQREFEKAEFGSLVITDQGNYFISVGMGKTDVDGVSYFAISPDSPLGKALKGKAVNDRVEFQNRIILIKAVC